MHSSLVRVQNVFGFFTTVTFSVAGLIALSVLFFPQSPSASVQVRNVQVIKGRPNYYSSKREEYAHIKFDLEADLTSLFTWNTKQVFLYVAATYPSSNPNSSSTQTSPSTAIIWDHIINSPAQLHPPSVWSFLGTTNSGFPPSARKDTKTKTQKAKGKETKKKKPDPSKPDPDAPPGIVSIKNVKPKYQITDISGQLAEREGVRLEVGWNVQPWVGALQWQDSLSSASSSSAVGGGAPRSLLGKVARRWRDMEGGRSEVFEFPSLVGKKKNEVPATEDVVVGKGEVPRGGEATPVVEI